MGLVSFLYPRQCVGCKKNGKYFCDRCLSKVRLDDEWRCSECNEKSIGGVTHFGCRNKDSLDGMVSF
ncbi:MAG: double zinc ribbon domain-containing protein, partial [Candidatus Beckwithbacteria bacterium]